jgi:hypothetical protein
MDPNDAIRRAMQLFDAQLHAVLKQLIEEKHLYQSLTIDTPKIEAETTSLTFPDKKYYAQQSFREYIAARWTVQQPTLPGEPPVGPLPTQKTPVLTFPTVKLFCEPCDRLEPYNLGQEYA